MSIEWAVGLFEGEGCLYRDKRCNTWTLQLRMTDEDVVKRFADIVQCGKINFEGAQPTRNKPNVKPCWRWDCSKKSEVKRVLTLFLPHFGNRRAYTTLNCFDSYDEHELNKRTKRST
jgi:hypothetical protein